MNIKKYQKLESELFQLKKVRVFEYITPTNIQDQKNMFLRGEIKEPDFEYLEPDYNTELVDKKINEVLSKIPNKGLGIFLTEKGKEIKMFNRVIRNIGNSKAMKDISLELYGKPDKKLLKESDSILKERHGEEVAKKTFGAKDVASRIEDYLNQLGLEGWKVVIENINSVAIFPLSKKVVVANLKKYSENDIKRIIVHEIDVHALRGENGHLQPLKVFARGLRRFISIGDGIALYLEKKNNVMDAQREREIALRVLAVDMAYNDASFRNVFEYINKHEPEKEKSWEITYRVFRGGGVLKDHLYLKGYLNILDFIEKGGEIKDLYVGRVGIEHLALTKKLVNQGILKKPKYIPEVFL